MAEVPPHLLERAKARRAAMGQGGADAGTPAVAATDVVPTETVAAPAVVRPVATTAAAAAPPVVVVPPTPRGLQFAKMAKVMLMAAVPVWAFFFAGTFVVPKSTVETEAALGARLYTANCSTCHLANGAGKEGGGVGRPLWKGQVELTFLKAQQQVAFVRHGSCGLGVPYGNPDRPGGQHKAIMGMPAFPETALTENQLHAIITYERSVLSEAVAYPTTLPGATTVPTPTIAPLTENVCGKTG